MRQQNKSEPLGILLVAISAFGYGLMPVLSTPALKAGTQVYTLLFMRFSIAAIVLWLYIFVKKEDHHTSFKNFIYLILLGLFGFTITSVTIYHAYELISASIATLILFTHPIFVMVLESLVRKRPITKKKLLALLIILLGLLAVLYQNDVSLNLRGIVFAFVSSITYAFYCFGIGEKETQKLSGIVVTAYITATTAFATGLISLYQGYPLIAHSPEGIKSGLTLAVFSTLLSSITFYEGLSIVGASSATLISSFEPVFVVILGFLFLHEIMTINVVLGGLFIILGVVILEYKKKPLRSDF